MKAVQILVLSLAALFFVVSATPVHAQNEFVGAYFRELNFLHCDIRNIGIFLHWYESKLHSQWQLVRRRREHRWNNRRRWVGYCPCFYQAGTATDNSGNVAYVIQFWGINGLIQGFQVNNVGGRHQVQSSLQRSGPIPSAQPPTSRPKGSPTTRIHKSKTTLRTSTRQAMSIRAIRNSTTEQRQLAELQ